jgi:hypothetical protein
MIYPLLETLLLLLVILVSQETLTHNFHLASGVAGFILGITIISWITYFIRKS